MGAAASHGSMAGVGVEGAQALHGNIMQQHLAAASLM
jgi:hypothetical protein